MNVRVAEPNDHGGDEEGGEEEEKKLKAAWPGLEEMASWVCVQLLQKPPPASVGVRGDARRLMNRFQESLEECAALNKSITLYCHTLHASPYV